MTLYVCIQEAAVMYAGWFSCSVLFSLLLCMCTSVMCIAVVKE